MSSSPETYDAQLEEIVAYLDGELSGEACARVERRLASDEDFRQQLQGVERAWTALDELPMTTVDDRFSRTTMSMVIEAAAQEVQTRTRALPIARRRRWLSTALAGAAAAALGFLVFRLAWHNPNTELIADLGVVDNIDVYGQFDNVTFLRRLHDELGGDLDELSGDAADLDSRRDHFVDVTTPAEGEKWLQSLTDDDRTTLRAKFNRFRELPDGERDRMRALHASIVSDKDSGQLERTMLAYQQWLGGLSPVRQFELRNTNDVDERIAQIKKWASEMRDDELLTLTDEELDSLFQDLRGPLRKLRSDVIKTSKKTDDREELKQILSEDFAKLRRAMVEQFEDRHPRDGFYNDVVNALPDRTRERFEELPPREKAERFFTWVRQHTACRGNVTLEDLETFFAEELDDETQAQLLALPPGEMEQRLRRMYKCQPKTGAEGQRLWQPSDDAKKNGGNSNTEGGDRNSGGGDRNRGDDRNRDDDRGRNGDGRGDRDGGPRNQPGGPPPGMRPPGEFNGPNGPMRRGFGPGLPMGPPPRGDRREGGPRRPFDGPGGPGGQGPGGPGGPPNGLGGPENPPPPRG